MPTVSAPSRVVRSITATASRRAATLDSFLMLRLARAAARSSAPTSSTANRLSSGPSATCWRKPLPASASRTGVVAMVAHCSRGAGTISWTRWSRLEEEPGCGPWPGRLVLLLVVAFVAGVWDARYEDERRPAASTAPFRTDPVERSRRSRPAPELVSVQTAERRRLRPGAVHLPGRRCRATRSATCPGSTDAGRRAAGPARGRRSWRWPSSRPGPATRTARRPSRPPPSPPATRSCARCASPATSRARSAFGLGVADRGGFRVSELRNPTRVAVDVR